MLYKLSIGTVCAVAVHGGKGKPWKEAQNESKKRRKASRLLRMYEREEKMKTHIPSWANEQEESASAPTFTTSHSEDDIDPKASMSLSENEDEEENAADLGPPIYFRNLQGPSALDDRTSPSAAIDVDGDTEPTNVPEEQGDGPIEESKVHEYLEKCVKDTVSGTVKSCGISVMFTITLHKLSF